LAAVVVFFVASGAALAEIGEGPSIDTFDPRPVDRQSPSPTPAPAAVTDQASCGFDQDSPLDAEFTDVLPVVALAQSSAATANPQPQTVHQLPAGPGGATLFLLGVGCIGAVKLGRSARSLHLQSLPDWYHTGGPIQVGHAAAFDFHYTPPALCTLVEPAGEQQLRHHPRRDLPLRCEDQFLLTVEAPRGPPFVS